MLVFLKTSLVLLVSVLAFGAHGQEKSARHVRHDHSALRETVRQFLQHQSAGLPGEPTISVGTIDSRLNLAHCPAPETFLPAGSKVWGKTTVGVRCIDPAWTVYIPATVRVHGNYIVTAAPLAQGKSITADDITVAQGDLTTLPAGIITDAGQAIGRTLSMSLPMGAPLRTDTLRTQQVIRQGQVVRLVTRGPGFQVSSEGRALTNANEGQVAQARAPNGQIVSGIAKAGGIVEVTY